MTLRRSSIKTERSRPLSGVGTLLTAKIRRNWSAFLLYTLLALVVPIFTVLGLLSDTAKFSQALYQTVCGVDAEIWFCVASALAALLAAVYAWRELFTKKSNYFAQKLPFRREAAFTANSLFGILLFVLPLLIMVSVFLILGACTVTENLGTYLSACLSYYFATVASYAAFFSVFSFCAVVCGSMGVFLPISVLTLFLLKLLSLVNLYFAEKIIGWSIGRSFLTELLGLSPIEVYRWFGKVPAIGLGKTLLHSLFLLLGAVALWLCALLLYRVLKAERSENAFTFHAARAIYKYVVLYLIMMLVGIIVGEIGDGVVAVFLGVLLIAIIGFICHLLINMIINKNAHRGVFRGWKAFCVLCAAVIAVFFATLVLSGSAMPAVPSLCRDMTFEMPLGPDPVTDPDIVSEDGISDKKYEYYQIYEPLFPVLVSKNADIKALLPLFENQEKEWVNRYDGALYEYDEETENRFIGINVRLHTVFGLTLSRYYLVRRDFTSLPEVQRVATKENVVKGIALAFRESDYVRLLPSERYNHWYSVSLKEKDRKTVQTVYCEELYDHFEEWRALHEFNATASFMLNGEYSYSFCIGDFMTETRKLVDAVFLENGIFLVSGK